MLLRTFCSCGNFGNLVNSGMMCRITGALSLQHPLLSGHSRDAVELKISFAWRFAVRVFMNHESWSEYRLGCLLSLAFRLNLKFLLDFMLTLLSQIRTFAKYVHTSRQWLYYNYYCCWGGTTIIIRWLSNMILWSAAILEANVQECRVRVKLSLDKQYFVATVTFQWVVTRN